MRRKPALTLNFISIDDIFKLPLEFVELDPPSRDHNSTEFVVSSGFRSRPVLV